MSEPLGPVIIGAREIYDKVIAVAAMVGELRADVANVQRDRADHEARIRALEKNRWPPHAIALVAMLVSVAALVIAVMPKLVN